ncbi:hypothetical protein RGQ29_022468 [Quercus rubra]|uniref:RING-type domain-containing protein n=1 Tax=Quercus rubra TaxID=3512 RepID=A0AAN7F3T5_QUERU|nr:hypothetical protein RGQ29_025474 [Quercus rubra]KAK4584779.1 hypothetical protein RGQ29_022468 [Quercus rubra]
MCSTIHVLSRVQLDLANSQSFNLTGSKEDDIDKWCFAIAFVARLFIYAAVLALLAVVVFMVMRYLEDLEDRRIEGEEGGTETNPLLPAKTMPITYGTCGEDLESGNFSCSSSSSSGSNNNTSTSSEDLYDGKVCVICYDEQRNCFFVPCGHCATCYACAQRIFNEENKTCPVCRRFIGKIRKLFAS